MENFQSGQYINQGYYKSFQPNFIDREWKILDMSILQLLSKADRHLGRLDMYSQYVNIELFIKMHIAKEATQSSKIEGTQTNIEEAFLKKEEVNFEKRNDWEEVQNYISAMNEAVKLLHTLPFSSRLIKQTHKILLQGVRGEHKLPGEYRTSQNWIGGASISDAVFIPPVHTSLNELMSDLEKFKANAGDIVIAMTGATIGKFAIVPKTDNDFYVNQRVGVFKLNELKKLPFLINTLNQDYFRKNIIEISCGAAQPNISNEQINNIELILPINNIVEKFNNKMTICYEKIIQNRYKVYHLQSLRDWLLPMLMNGQISVE